VRGMPSRSSRSSSSRCVAMAVMTPAGPEFWRSKSRNARSVVYHRRVVMLSEDTTKFFETLKYFNLDHNLECEASSQFHETP
jgi:hypothetical protein